MIESIEIFDVESYLNFKLKVFQFILSILELQFKTEPDEETIVKNIKKSVIIIKQKNICGGS